VHPAEIQAALKVAGYSQSALADEVGVRPSAVSMVINGRSRSTQIEERIAAITGYALAELWPVWHGDAKPLVLTDEERTLVLRYRELAPWQREQVLPVMRTMLSDAYAIASRGAQHQPKPDPTVAAGSNASTGGKSTVVTARGRGSRAAGRDYIEREKPKRIERGKPKKPK